MGQSRTDSISTVSLWYLQDRWKNNLEPSFTFKILSMRNIHPSSLKTITEKSDFLQLSRMLWGLSYTYKLLSLKENYTSQMLSYTMDKSICNSLWLTWTTVTLPYKTVAKITHRSMISKNNMSLSSAQMTTALNK